jgi:serine/threonine protein kinase
LIKDEDPVPTPTGIDIGKYKNATYYREGLFSAIYKAPAAQDAEYSAESIKGLVALKVTTPSMMEPPHDSRREARILALSASQHVIPLLETFHEAGSHYVLVFPFVPYDFGRLLRDGKMSQRQIRDTLRDLFIGLEFVHARGIIHRDIKPSNIMLNSPDGPAYLADFGISWAPNVPGSELAHEKITDVGTTCYRPPELLFGNKGYGCNLDLWAAGCTVAEALVLGNSTLFDSGELGSDLALIQSIFSKLGTPNLTVWPVSTRYILHQLASSTNFMQEAANLPDWGKVQFHEYPAQPWSALLPNVSDTERDLVSRLVQYESGLRISAAQVR